MSVVWAQRALHDLENIERFVGKDDARALAAIVDRLLSAVGLLQQQPGVGRPGRVAHTREFVVSGTPYTIAYRVQAANLQVLRVLHSSRKWPKQL